MNIEELYKLASGPTFPQRQNEPHKSATAINSEWLSKQEWIKLQKRNRIQNWKLSEEGQYMKKHCLKQYYDTLQEIEGWNRY